MCGRVTLTLDKQTVMDILQDVFQVSNQLVLQEPSSNIGPGQQVLSVIEHKGQRRGGYLTFGTKAPWIKDKTSKLIINARSETVDSKAMFKDPFKYHRCIVVADGFYEWKREERKIPYHFTVTDQPIMPLAAVYIPIKNQQGQMDYGFTIITCEPNPLMKPIHHRMPVILDEEGIELWLAGETSPNRLKELLKPYNWQNMQVKEVASL